MSERQPEPAGLIPVSDTENGYTNLPEVVSSIPASEMERDKIPAEAIPGESGLMPVEEEKKTIWGMGARKFWILVVVAAVVIAAAIAGGVAGGLTAGGGGNRDSSGQDDGSSDSTSSPTPTSSEPSDPGPTGPTAPEDRAIAASLSSDNNVQLFYQDINTTNLLYRLITDDESAKERTLDDLDIEPRWATPLTAAAIPDSDPPTVNLFYLSDSSESLEIVQAILECDPDESSCSTVTNRAVSVNVSDATVHPETKLAALCTDDADIRLFWQSNDTDIMFLTNGNHSLNWGSAHLMSDGYPGTGLATVAPDLSAIHLFYVPSDTRSPSVVIYSDVLGADSTETLRESPGVTWDPTNSITAMYIPESNPYQLYYSKPDNGLIVALWEPSGEPGTWNAQQNDEWGRVTGGLASVAWGDQSRMYYFQDDTLLISVQSGEIWSDALPL